MADEGHASAARAKGFLLIIVAYLVAGVAGCLSTWALRNHSLILAVGVGDVVATIAMFGFSLAFNNSSFYDIYWSIAPMVIAGGLFRFAPHDVLSSPRRIVVLVLIQVWGARLTWNWIRSWGGLQHEDWRYVDLRKSTGSRYWLASFFGLHLFPTIITFLGGLAMFPVFVSGADGFNIIDGVAIFVMAGAIILETTADEQLRAFRQKSRTPGRIMDNGLWSLCRHPNYLGEMLFLVGALPRGHRRRRGRMVDDHRADLRHRSRRRHQRAHDRQAFDGAAPRLRGAHEERPCVLAEAHSVMTDGAAEAFGQARLYVLFGEPRELDLRALAANLASFAPALAHAVIELRPEAGVAAVRFGDHELTVRASSDPLSEWLLEPAVQLAHYDPADKARARGHRCYVLVEHAPSSLHPMASARAAALVAAAIATLGGEFVVNVGARTSVPAGIFEHPPEIDMVTHIETLPPLVLFMGLGKYVVEGREGIWMRTHGGPLLGTPDFARLAASHAEGLATFTLFNHAIAYALEAAVPLAPGDVMQGDDGAFLRLRALAGDDPVLGGDGPMLVVEEVEVAES